LHDLAYSSVPSCRNNDFAPFRRKPLRLALRAPRGSRELLDEIIVEKSLNASVGLVICVLALVGGASLVDCGFRTMAENKARQAERTRFLKWGLPPAPVAEEPQSDEHLWHF
jgi:hypothetical protein